MDAALPLLEAFRKDLYHCSDCNYCVDAVWQERGMDHICATITHHAPVLSYSGRGYMAAARALLEGQALNPATLAERAFSCTGCGNCEASCPIGLRPTQVGQALRETLAEQGVLPPGVEALRLRMREAGNAYGAESASRTRWAEGLAFASAATATVNYAPGCAAAHARPAEARAAVALMTLGGERVHFAAATDACCGAPLAEAGLRADAAYAEQALAARNTTTRLVTSGLECLPAWQRGGVVAGSFAQWLIDALADGRLRLTPKASRPPTVQVFDSCASRRPGGAPDPLRDALAALGQAVANPPLEARYAVCCGAAGSLSELHPLSAARMAAARVPADDHLPVVGSDPRCLGHLAAGGQAERYYGLAEFVLAAFDVQGAA